MSAQHCAFLLSGALILNDEVTRSLYRFIITYMTKCWLGWAIMHCQYCEIPYRRGYPMFHDAPIHPIKRRLQTAPVVDKPYLAT